MFYRERKESNGFFFPYMENASLCLPVDSVHFSIPPPYHTEKKSPSTYMRICTLDRPIRSRTIHTIPDLIYYIPHADPKRDGKEEEKFGFDAAAWNDVWGWRDMRKREDLSPLSALRVLSFFFLQWTGLALILKKTWVIWCIVYKLHIYIHTYVQSGLAAEKPGDWTPRVLG